MIKKMGLFLSTLILLALFPAHGEKLSGEIFELTSKRKTKLFTNSISVNKTETETSVENVFLDLEGTLVLTESARLKGFELISYEIDQKQTGEKGRVFVKDGVIHFVYEENGKKKESQEKVKGDLVLTANFGAYIQSRWAELMAGKKLEFRFAVWDRLETVGFSLQKIGTENVEGRAAVEFKLKPSSFLIAALVDPIHLWYSETDQQLILYRGRVAPKVKLKGVWKPLDAEAVYRSIP